ncbi:MAG: isoprenylcysteine carboxylmethyltransferase family protein [Pseudomonadota bacterium]
MGGMSLTDMLAGVSLLAVLGVFGAITLASFRHFARDRDSMGMKLIRVLSLTGTLGLTGLSIWQSGPFPMLAIVALLFAGLSWRILTLALQATDPGTLDVAFTGTGPDELVTSGIYAQIRNPLYSAYIVYWAAWVPLTGFHWISVLVLMGFVGLYVLAAVQEEAFLRRSHGISYQMYEANTGRFLPRIF